MEREVLNAEEAAEFLGVDRKTVYEAVARRQLPHRRLGKRILFSRAALLEWLSAGPPPSSAPKPAPATPVVRDQAAARPKPSRPEPVYSWRRTTEGIDELKVKVMAVVERKPGYGAQVYARHMGTIASDIGDILSRLVADGRLVKSGYGRATVYRPA